MKFRQHCQVQKYVLGWPCAASLVIPLSPMEFFHAFLSSADFEKNQLFWKDLSGIPSECQTDWIQIRPNVLSGLIWVQTVCKSYQHFTKIVLYDARRLLYFVFIVGPDFSSFTRKEIHRILPTLRCLTSWPTLLTTALHSWPNNIGAVTTNLLPILPSCQ